MNKAEKHLQQWNDFDRKNYIASTKNHLSFLESVMKYPSLIQGDHLTNAVRRYEMYWLPLCKKHGTMSCDEWAAPLDVAWVWYLHMLIPENYINDCKCLIVNAPNHALKSGKALESALTLTKSLWDKSYESKEPFDVNLEESLQLQEYRPKLKHDFHVHSLRQRNFYYQVSLPHYHDDKFLDDATERYVTHLGLQIKNPSLALSPPVDVQLIMYSHQLNPIFYNYQINVILGKIVSPEYLVDSKQHMKKQRQIDVATEKVWKEAGLELCKPGTLCRGEPPRLFPAVQQVADRLSMLRQEFSLSVTKIDLKNLEHHTSYLVVFEGAQGEMYKVKVKVNDEKIHNRFPSMDSENGGVEYVQLDDFPSDKHKQKGKGKASGFTHPMYSLLGEDSSVQDQDSRDAENLGDTTHTVGDGHTTLVQVNTSTSDTTNVKVSLYQIDKNRVHSTKVLVGESDLDVFKFVDPKDVQPSTKNATKICLPLDFQCDGPFLRVTLSISPIGSGNFVFQVSPEYGFAKFKHICSALTYPSLMLPLSTITSPEAQAEVITYPILDYRGTKAFTCRVVRSVGATDIFYAIEILNKGGEATATSHLLSPKALPYKTNLSSSRGCAYYSPEETEIAMLVRGQEDWGLCIGRKMSLHHFGKGNSSALALRLFLLRDRTNSYCCVRKFKNSLYLFKIASTDSKADHKPYIYLHLSEGKFVMSSDVTEVPEILALALSSLVLQYLFCEQDQDCWSVIDGEGVDLFSIFQTSDNLGFTWDGKYDGGEGGRDDPCSFVSEVDC